jgi:hypothetical protein
MHQCCTFADADEFIMLIEPTVFENHNSIVGPRLRVLQLDHLGFNSNGVAVEQRLWKSHIVPPQIGNRRTDRCIADRYADHEAQGQATVDQGFAELRRFAVLRIDVQRRGIVRQRTEPNIVGFSDCPVNRVIECLTYGELFEIQTWHRVSPTQLLSLDNSRIGPFREILPPPSASQRCGFCQLMALGPHHDFRARRETCYSTRILKNVYISDLSTSRFRWSAFCYRTILDTMRIEMTFGR